MYLEIARDKIMGEVELHLPVPQLRPQAKRLLEHQIEAIIKQYGKDLLINVKTN